MSSDTRTSAIADVYAGDIAQSGSTSISAAQVFAYRIEADAEPDVLARIAGICNLANVAPRRVSLDRFERGSVLVEIELDGISIATADSIRRKLLQLTCVTGVSLG
jgi:hypothetical protein